MQLPNGIRRPSIYAMHICCSPLHGKANATESKGRGDPEEGVAQCASQGYCIAKLVTRKLEASIDMNYTPLEYRHDVRFHVWVARWQGGPTSVLAYLQRSAFLEVTGSKASHMQHTHIALARRQHQKLARLLQLGFQAPNCQLFGATVEVEVVEHLRDVNCEPTAHDICGGVPKLRVLATLASTRAARASDLWPHPPEDLRPRPRLSGRRRPQRRSSRH